MDNPGQGNITSRPALVIGVGGTGQWVLAYLKKDLMESYGGEIPQNIRLLGLDTLPMSEGQVETGQNTDSDELKEHEKRAKAGAVKLADREFIHLGGNSRKIAELIKNGGHPHLGLWFQAREWLHKLRPLDFSLDRGAGRNRQFGRIAASMDFLGGKVDSEVWKILGPALANIKSMGEKKEHVEIIIVGSFAGGTGSGMFLDIALLAKWAANLNNIDVGLRGYFVLPKTFAQYNQEMMARTFAAWRELNRFMSVGTDGESLKVILAPGQKEFEVEIKERLFDTCYLVDSFLGENPLGVKPKHGVFPVIADAISMILDVEAGGPYLEAVERNLTRIYERYPGQPMYSTLNTYTFKVPVYYHQQEFALGLSKEVLEKILAPIPDEIGGFKLSTNSNSEKGVLSGDSESLEILRAARHEYKDSTAYGNLFSKELANIAENVDRGELMERHLNRAMSAVKRGGKAAGAWVKRITDLGEEMGEGEYKARVTQLKLSITAELDFSLAEALPDADPGKGDLQKRIGAIQKRADILLLTHYGVGEAKGSFGDLLEEISDYQIRNFKKVMKIWLLKTLNGADRTDSAKAVGGKLGYARSGISGLEFHLGRVGSFLDEVEKERDIQAPLLSRKSRAEGSFERATDLSGISYVFGLIPHLGAKPSVDQYRMDLHGLGLLKREILAFDAVKDIVNEMLNYLKVLILEIDRWGNGLLIDSTSGFEGLYMEVNNELNNIRRTHAADEDLKAIQTIYKDDDVLDKDGKLKNSDAVNASGNKQS